MRHTIEHGKGFMYALTIEHEKRFYKSTEGIWCYLLVSTVEKITHFENLVTGRLANTMPVY